MRVVAVRVTAAPASGFRLGGYGRSYTTPHMHIAATVVGKARKTINKIRTNNQIDGSPAITHICKNPQPKAQ
jgi:hypothetical protein